ncbi:MAG TPA: hypothetical protein VK489_04495 [Ferruginibacter sp.]|nr:hypothetical protein [Ferruginibacter sp.]
MKSKRLKLLNLTFVALSIFIFISCNKSDDSQDESSSFTWTWSAITYNGNFKEAYLQSLSVTPVIIAGMGTSLQSPGTGPRISLNSFNVGSYNLVSGIANTISFVAPNGDNLQSTSGTLTITSNSNNKMNGNFSATLINAVGLNSSLIGSFTNLRISQ